jgi:hypothetical protein
MHVFINKSGPVTFLSGKNEWNSRKVALTEAVIFSKVGILAMNSVLEHFLAR